MVTQVMSKVPLSMREDKRFWFCKDNSVAYGHWLSYQGGYRDGHVVCIKGGQIVPLIKGNIQIEIEEEEIDTVSENIDLYNRLYALMLTSDQNDSDLCQDIDAYSNGDGPGIKLGDSHHISEPISLSGQKRKCTTSKIDISLNPSKRK